MARKMIDWLLGAAGTVFVPEVGFKVGLATRNFASDKGLAPRGKSMKAAVEDAKARGLKSVSLELLLIANGDATIKDAGEKAKLIRGRQARARKLVRAEAVATAKEAAAKARKDKREAKKNAAEAAKEVQTA